MRPDRRHRWAMWIDPKRRRDELMQREAYCVSCGRIEQIEDPRWADEFMRDFNPVKFVRFLNGSGGDVITITRVRNILPPPS